MSTLHCEYDDIAVTCIDYDYVLKLTRYINKETDENVRKKEVNLLSYEGKHIVCNKLTLECLSNYFARMLAGYVNYERCIQLKYKYEPFSEVINYACSGVIKISLHNVFDILYIAKGLYITFIIDSGVKFIQENMNDDICMNAFNFGNKHMYVKIIKSANTYILSNFELLILKNVVQEIGQYELRMFLCSDELNVRSEDIVLHAVISWFKYKPGRNYGVLMLLPKIRTDFLSRNAENKLNEFVRNELKINTFLRGSWLQPRKSYSSNTVSKVNKRIISNVCNIENNAICNKRCKINENVDDLIYINDDDNIQCNNESNIIQTNNEHTPPITTTSSIITSTLTNKTTPIPSTLTNKTTPSTLTNKTTPIPSTQHITPTKTQYNNESDASAIIDDMDDISNYPLLSSVTTNTFPKNDSISTSDVIKQSLDITNDDVCFSDVDVNNLLDGESIDDLIETLNTKEIENNMLDDISIDDLLNDTINNERIENPLDDNTLADLANTLYQHTNTYQHPTTDDSTKVPVTSIVSKYKEKDNNDWNLFNTNLDNISEYDTAILNGIVYVIGGCYKGTITNQVSSFDMVKFELVHVPSMNVAKMSSCTVGCNNRLYVVGGYNNTNKYLDIVESWAPGDSCWKYEPDLNVPRAKSLITYNGSNIYVFGGFVRGDKVTYSVELLDQNTKNWIMEPYSRYSHFSASIINYQEKIYILGGMSIDISENVYYNVVERYNYKNKLWEKVASLNVNRTFATASVSNNKLYIQGGYMNNQAVIEVEIFNEKTNKWKIVSNAKKYRKKRNADE
ncbi:kelch-like protein [Cetacean poxvirus 1]|nr:kelch-like protein [Cetacean poxvirus 1]